MSAAKRYAVAVYRRQTQQGMQLNFTDADRANATFASMATFEGRKVFTDDFGAKLSMLSDDIGPVLFIDQTKAVEFKVDVAVDDMLTQHRAQKRAQAEAEKEVVIPRASLTVPAGQKFG